MSQSSKQKRTVHHGHRNAPVVLQDDSNLQEWVKRVKPILATKLRQHVSKRTDLKRQIFKRFEQVSGSAQGHTHVDQKAFIQLCEQLGFQFNERQINALFASYDRGQGYVTADDFCSDLISSELNVDAWHKFSEEMKADQINQSLSLTITNTGVPLVPTSHQAHLILAQQQRESEIAAQQSLYQKWTVDQILNELNRKLEGTARTRTDKMHHICVRFLAAQKDPTKQLHYSEATEQAHLVSITSQAHTSPSIDRAGFARFLFALGLPVSTEQSSAVFAKLCGHPSATSLTLSKLIEQICQDVEGAGFVTTPSGPASDHSHSHHHHNSSSSSSSSSSISSSSSFAPNHASNVSSSNKSGVLSTSSDVNNQSGNSYSSSLSSQAFAGSQVSPASQLELIAHHGHHGHGAAEEHHVVDLPPQLKRWKWPIQKLKARIQAKIEQHTSKRSDQFRQIFRLFEERDVSLPSLNNNNNNNTGQGRALRLTPEAFHRLLRDFGILLDDEEARELFRTVTDNNEKSMYETLQSLMDDDPHSAFGSFGIGSNDGAKHYAQVHGTKHEEAAEAAAKGILSDLDQILSTLQAKVISKHTRSVRAHFELHRACRFFDPEDTGILPLTSLRDVLTQFNCRLGDNQLKILAQAYPAETVNNSVPSLNYRNLIDAAMSHQIRHPPRPRSPFYLHDIKPSGGKLMSAYDRFPSKPNSLASTLPPIALHNIKAESLAIEESADSINLSSTQPFNLTKEEGKSIPRRPTSSLGTGRKPKPAVFLPLFSARGSQNASLHESGASTHRAFQPQPPAAPREPSGSMTSRSVRTNRFSEYIQKATKETTIDPPSKPAIQIGSSSQSSQDEVAAADAVLTQYIAPRISTIKGK